MAINRDKGLPGIIVQSADKLIRVLNIYIVDRAAEINKNEGNRRNNVLNYLASIYQFLGVKFDRPAQEKLIMDFTSKYASGTLPQELCLASIRSIPGVSNSIPGFSYDNFLQQDLSQKLKDLESSLFKDAAINPNSALGKNFVSVLDEIKKYVGRLNQQENVNTQKTTATTPWKIAEHKPSASPPATPVAPQRNKPTKPNDGLSLTTLPSEILTEIASKMKPDERAGFTQASKMTKVAAEDEALWRKDIKTDFPDQATKPGVKAKTEYTRMFKETKLLYLTAFNCPERDNIASLLKARLSALQNKHEGIAGINKNNLLGITENKGDGFTQLPQFGYQLALSNQFALELKISPTRFNELFSEGKIDEILKNTTAVVEHSRADRAIFDQCRKPDGTIDQAKADQLCLTKTPAKVVDGKLVIDTRMFKETKLLYLTAFNCAKRDKIAGVLKARLSALENKHEGIAGINKDSLLGITENKGDDFTQLPQFRYHNALGNQFALELKISPTRFNELFGEGKIDKILKHTTAVVERSLPSKAILDQCTKPDGTIDAAKVEQLCLTITPARFVDGKLVIESQSPAPTAGPKK